jgi:L-lysine exporter family protein LysE/ArgO
MDLFISGLLLSLSLCLDLGIVNVAVMKTGVERGAWPALMIGLGSSVGDIVYATLSLVGISFLLNILVVRWALWIGGTVVMLLLAVTMVRHSLKPPNVEMSGGGQGGSEKMGDFIWGIGLALSSPSAILWFATVGGSVIATTHMESKLSLLMFFGGFFFASMTWSVVLAMICHQAGHMLGPTLMRWFSLASAGLFLFFAAKVFISGYLTLL